MIVIYKLYHYYLFNQDEFNPRGPDIKAMNASIMKDPSMEALELSERTVPGKGGKAGPQGRKLVELNITEILV